MPELTFDTVANSCVIGDERTSAGAIHLRLIASEEVQDGGATRSVWDWKFASHPETASFAGTVRGPSFRTPGAMFTTAGAVLHHVHKLLEQMGGVENLRRFREAAVHELSRLQ